MESSTLAPVLSYILTKMVERNDKIPLDDSKRTVFHAQKAPIISLHRYLERVLSFAPCSNSCFIIALIYIDRIIQSSDFILNSLSVHRMLITSVMLATKFFDDETFNNQYYAKVGGLQVCEVNQLESKFLSLLDFSLTIRSELYDRYHCELVKHSKVNGTTKITPPTRSKLTQQKPGTGAEDTAATQDFPTSTSSPSPSPSTSSPSPSPSPSTSLSPSHKDHATHERLYHKDEIHGHLKSHHHHHHQSRRHHYHHIQSHHPIVHRHQSLNKEEKEKEKEKKETETEETEEKGTYTNPTQTPSQIRSICESLVAETMKNNPLESQLMGRMRELLNVEEKLHRKVPPCSIKTMCTKLALEHNLPSSFVAQATLQAERLERESNKSNSSYQTGFDYTARDMISTASDSPSSTSSNGSSVVGEGTGISTGAMKGRANFSTCTPSYPNNNNQIYGNRILGVI